MDEGSCLMCSFLLSSLVPVPGSTAPRCNVRAFRFFSYFQESPSKWDTAVLGVTFAIYSLPPGGRVRFGLFCSQVWGLRFRVQPPPPPPPVLTKSNTTTVSTPCTRQCRCISCLVYYLGFDIQPVPAVALPLQQRTPAKTATTVSTSAPANTDSCLICDVIFLKSSMISTFSHLIYSVLFLF